MITFNLEHIKAAGCLKEANYIGDQWVAADHAMSTVSLTRPPKHNLYKLPRVVLGNMSGGETDSYLLSKPKI